MKRPASLFPSLGGTLGSRWVKPSNGENVLGRQRGGHHRDQPAEKASPETCQDSIDKTLTC
ncbi:MAG: hypothetical protein V8Q84_04335 [Bilophila sp.]